MNHWKILEDKSSDSWLEVQDPEGWYSAVVRFDGCIHLNRHHNYPLSERDNDYIHICDIDDMIERLESLKKLALDYYVEWPL